MRVVPFNQPCLRSRELDCAFIDLDHDQDGLAKVRLGCPDGRTVELWADRAYQVIQAFTADPLAPARRRRGLAAEPMTAPANALQTGEIVCIDEQNPYFAMIRDSWGQRLRHAFESIDDPDWNASDARYPLKVRSERFEVLRKIRNPDEKII